MQRDFSKLLEAFLNWQAISCRKNPDDQECVSGTQHEIAEGLEFYFGVYRL
jgi:hypothetical protein